MHIIYLGVLALVQYLIVLNIILQLFAVDVYLDILYSLMLVKHVLYQIVNLAQLI